MSNHEPWCIGSHKNGPCQAEPEPPRDTPAHVERCPTCDSEHPAYRRLLYPMYVDGRDLKTLRPEEPCTNPWHDALQAKPIKPLAAKDIQKAGHEAGTPETPDTENRINTPYAEKSIETPSALSAAPIRQVASMTVESWTCAADYAVRLDKQTALFTPYFEAYAADLRSKLSTAERERDRESASHLCTIDERDSAEDALQKAHIALGGDGEWVTKFPPAHYPPGETGDLRIDVPALAAQFFEAAQEADKRAEAAEVELARVREALQQAAAESWQVKTGLMGIRESTELSPNREQWIEAKIEQWLKVAALRTGGEPK